MADPEVIPDPVQMPARTDSPEAGELIAAAKLGDVAALRRALERGVSVDARDENGKTALHHAAQGFRLEAIEFLLAAGAPVDAEDRWHCTPLWYAVVGPGGIWLGAKFEERRRPCVRALVLGGANPEHKCRPERYARFEPPTPWRRGDGVRGAFASAIPDFGVDPEFCTPDQPFQLQGGLKSNRTLRLDARRTDACLGFAQKHGIESIDVTWEVPESQRDKLRELRHLPKLRRLTVRNRKGDAMDWIEALEDLEELLVLDPVRTLDLSRFHRVRTLDVAWCSRLVLPPVEAPLEHLGLLSWTPKPSDLRTLRAWKTVRHLSIGLGSLASLAGIEMLENLESAYFVRLRNLVDVQALANCRKLRKLHINDCRRAVQVDVLRQLVELEELVLVGRFGIPSLRFLDDLPRLRNVRLLHVDVEDGDLTPLLRIEEPAVVPHKRHYKLTAEQFAERHAQQADQRERERAARATPATP